MKKYKKELTLITLEVIICVIGGFLELETKAPLYQVFIIPIVAALMLYSFAIFVQGKQHVVYSTYVLSFAIGCLALAATLSSCALVQGVEDAGTAIPLMIILSGGISLIGGLIHLDKINNK